MKQCNKCLQDKNENEFCKNKQYKDGLNNYCRQCKKEYNAANVEANAKRWNKYYQEHKSELKANILEWKRNNKKLVAATEKKWRLNNSDRFKEINDKWASKLGQGIYAIFADGTRETYLYIGESGTLHRRMLRHRSRFPNAMIDIIHPLPNNTPIEVRKQLETQYIQQYDPIFNRHKIK